VRPAAQIDERAVGVHRDDLILFQVIDSLQLERIVPEAFLRLSARQLFASERVIRFDHLAHLLFDRRDVLGVNGRPMSKS